MPPEVPLLYRTVLATLSILLFHMKLSIILSRSVKNFAGHCIESVLPLLCLGIPVLSKTFIMKECCTLLKAFSSPDSTFFSPLSLLGIPAFLYSALP